MSYSDTGEWVDDTSPETVHEWCPTCSPDHAPEPWIMKYCGIHLQSHDGAADVSLGAPFYLSGNAEAGGDENRAFCDLIRPR